MAVLTRVAKTAPATLTHTFVVGETPTDAAGSVTVAVTDATGASVTSGTASHGATGQYTFALAGQAQLAQLTVAWTGTISGSSVTETDQVEVVGGFFFTLLEARGSDSVLADQGKYPPGDLVVARVEVEDECERICDRAFVPRYRRAVLDGSGTPDLLLTDWEWAQQDRSVGDVRTIRSASVAPQVGQTFTALTSDQLAACVVTSDGMLRRVDGGIWSEGVRNVRVEYEYGLDAPSADLVRAAKTRLRTRLTLNKGSVPDRATSFTAADGGTYRIDLPGAWKTGIPEVDAVYARYSRRSGSGTGVPGRGVPAARTLTYEPQVNSIFHRRL